MKAVALDQFFSHHQSAFWNFIERLIHFKSSALKAELNSAEEHSEILSGLKFFDEEGDFDEYVKSFRD